MADDAAAKLSLKLPLLALAFDAPRRLVLTGGGGGAAKTGIVNELLLLSSSPTDSAATAPSLQLTSRLSVGTEALNSVALHPTRDLCAFGSANRVAFASFAGKDRQLLLTATPIVCESAPERELRALAFNKAGSRLASGGADGVLRLWVTPSDAAASGSKVKAGKKGASASASESGGGGKPLAQLALGDEVHSIDFSADDALVLAASNALLRVWKIASGQLVAEIACPTSGAVPHRFRGAGFGGDSAHIVASLMRPAARRVDGESLLTKWRLDAAVREPTKAASVVAATRVLREHHTASRVSADGKHVVIATGDGGLLVTAVGETSFSPAMKLTKAHGFVVTAVAMSGALIASASLDHTVALTPLQLNARRVPTRLVLALLLLLLVAALYFFSQQQR